MTDEPIDDRSLRSDVGGGLLRCIIALLATSLHSATWADCLPSYSSRTAVTALNRVMSFTGMSPSTVHIRATRSIDSAVATICNGRRYIYVNESFLKLTFTTTDWRWANVGVLAHEIGHHVLGHPLLGPSDHEKELKADYYAGNLLARMGSPLDEALAMARYLPVDPTASHPGRDARKKAIEGGWHQAINPLPLFLSGDTLPDMQQSIWDKGLAIDAIAYGPSDRSGVQGYQWHVIASPDRDLTGRQRFSVGPDFPENWITAGWTNGQWIEELSYYSGTWIAIMGSRASYRRGRQIWFNWQDFPEDEIDKKWDEGLCISSVTQDGKRWGIVMTEAQCTQKWWSGLSGDELVEIAEEHWEDDFFITSMIWTDSRKWVLVMTHGRSGYGEKWYVKDFLPHSLISGDVRNGYRVSHMNYDGDDWVVVMTQLPRGIKGSPF